MFQYDYDYDDDDDDNDDDIVVGWRQGAVQKTSPQGVPRTSATPHFHDHLLLINWAHYEDDDDCGDDGESGDRDGAVYVSGVLVTWNFDPWLTDNSFSLFTEKA